MKVDRRQLDSWKAIASFLARNESTVRRWERQRHLPVHRVPGAKRSAVFAYTDELTTWLGGEPPDSTARPTIHLTIVAALVVVAIVASVWIAIASRTPVNAAPRSAESVAPTRSVTPQAYDAYLRGRYLFDRRNRLAFAQAVDALNQAVAMAPNYAAAYSALADVYTVFGVAGAPPAEVLPKAKAAASKALELDAQLAAAHASMGAIHSFYDWDWPAAEREFARATELDPGYALAHYWHGAICLAPRGRHAEAIAKIKRAQELDPRAPYITSGLGQAYYFARQYDRAIEQARVALQLDPSFEPAFTLREYSYREKGMVSEAAAVRLSSSDRGYVKSSERILETSGYQGLLRQYVRAREAQAPQFYVSPYYLAFYDAAVGDRDLALAWLQKAADQHHPALIFLADPVFDGIRSDWRFQQIVRRVGLPLDVPRTSQTDH